MPKHIKGNAARTPPAPGATVDDIDVWSRGLMPGVQPLATYLDEQIRAVVPGLQFAIKRGHVFYGLPGLGWIVELAAYHVSVNVLFLGGADFPEPPPLGDTDRTRYVKLASIEEAERSDLKRWLEHAAVTPGWA